MDYSKMGGAKPHKGTPRHKPKGGERDTPQKGRASKEELLARMKKAAEERKGD